MPSFLGNDPYLRINTVDIEAEWISVEPSFGGNTQETTHGAGATHVQREPGLKDNTFTVMITWPNTTTQTFLSSLAPQTKVVFEWGPEGNTAGKPKHLQTVIIDSNDGITQGVDKPPVTMTINMSGAAAPTTDIMAGGTY